MAACCAAEDCLFERLLTDPLQQIMQPARAPRARRKPQTVGISELASRQAYVYC